MNLPIDLYYKILSYGAIEPPHVKAIKNKLNLRPIFNCELNSKITGTIKLNNDEIDLDDQWEMFLLMNQE